MVRVLGLGRCSHVAAVQQAQMQHHHEFTPNMHAMQINAHAWQLSSKLVAHRRNIIMVDMFFSHVLAILWLVGAFAHSLNPYIMCGYVYVCVCICVCMCVCMCVCVCVCVCVCLFFSVECFLQYIYFYFCF